MLLCFSSFVLIIALIHKAKGEAGNFPLALSLLQLQMKKLESAIREQHYVHSSPFEVAFECLDSSYFQSVFFLNRFNLSCIYHRLRDVENWKLQIFYYRKPPIKVSICVISQLVTAASSALC